MASDDVIRLPESETSLSPKLINPLEGITETEEIPDSSEISSSIGSIGSKLHLSLLYYIEQ